MTTRPALRRGWGNGADSEGEGKGREGAWAAARGQRRQPVRLLHAETAPRSQG